MNSFHFNLKSINVTREKKEDACHIATAKYLYFETKAVNSVLSYTCCASKKLHGIPALLLIMVYLNFEKCSAFGFKLIES